jgi:hypothetical protein
MKAFFWSAVCFASLLILSSVTSLSHAGTMLSPVAVLGTDLGTFDPAVPLENMINQSSIDKPFTSGMTDFDEYFTTGAQPFGQGGPGNWQSDFSFNLPLMGFVDFDLGDTYTMDRLAIWNRSLENVEIYFSDTPGGLTTLGGSYRLTNHLNFPFSYLPEILELNTTVEARYMRFQINSTYKFDVTDTFAYAIVGEVVVETTSGGFTFSADFDGDGDVDIDDLDDWQAAYGATALADADTDGDSDGADFLAWQRQYGSGVGPLASIAAVPEPGTMWLVLCAGFTAIRCRRSKHVMLWRSIR